MTIETQVTAPPRVRMRFVGPHPTIPDIQRTLGAIDDLWIASFTVALTEHPVYPLAPPKARTWGPQAMWEVQQAVEKAWHAGGSEPGDSVGVEVVPGDSGLSEVGGLIPPFPGHATLREWPVVPRPERTTVSLASPLYVELVGQLLPWLGAGGGALALARGAWKVFTWSIEHHNELSEVRDKFSSERRRRAGDADHDAVVLMAWFPADLDAQAAEDDAEAGERILENAERSAVRALALLRSAGLADVAHDGVEAWTRPS